MTDRHPQPIVLDTTVCSNFARTDAIDVLVTVLESPVVVSAVREEVEHGHALGQDYLSSVVRAFDEGLPVADPPATSRDIQVDERLDAGEAESLRCALERNGTLATDDLAARRTADDLSVPVTGSVGILVFAVERRYIDRSTADSWLDTWRDERGYYAPVRSVSEMFESR